MSASATDDAETGPDRLDRYAQAAWRHRCERMAEQKERPPDYGTWDGRARFLKEIDRSAASLVAAMAVHDAGLEATQMRVALGTVAAHLPVILQALEAAEDAAGHVTEKRPYRQAREALERTWPF